MRVYHFVNRRYGLEDLKLKRLKIAEIGDLNDPFELRGVGSTVRQVRQSFERTRAELAKDRGLLCFSSRWRNPVLWSHYADRHRGICLGFETPDEWLTPVIYEAKRIDFQPGLIEAGGPEAEAYMRQTLTTKYSHWRYESEVRCFLSLEDRDPDRNLYFFDFSEDLRLREVIVGSESDVTRAELADALGDLVGEVSVLKARLAFRSFRVVRQRDPKRWE